MTVPHFSHKSAFKKKLLHIFWPIEKAELPLFIPMALMMFCILFNFSALRILKDSLVVAQIGAESISFLKLWLVFPSAVIFTLIYVKLTNYFKAETIFYIIVSIFLVIFCLFGFLIYPNRDLYHPSAEFINYAIISLPHLKWFIKILENWSYAVIYVFGELWGVVMVQLLFWQFVNSVTSSEKAKRTYPLLTMIGNMGLILSGNLLVHFSNVQGVSPKIINLVASHINDDTEITIKLTVIVVFISTIFATILFHFMNRYVKKHNIKAYLHSTDDIDHTTKLNLRDSIKMIISSKYLIYIFMMVLCYGLTINIVEGPWKAKIRELYPNTNDYTTFMGTFNIWMGISCILFTILGSNILRSCKWGFAAAITPVMILITGGLFFVFVIFGSLFDYMHFALINPLIAAVMFGALQNILSKSTKYSLFDSTKEMSFIPLGLEHRTKGKAAVELIATKLGKSSGALIQSFIFTVSPAATFEFISPFLMAIFILFIAIWLTNVRKLSVKYETLMQQNDRLY